MYDKDTKLLQEALSDVFRAAAKDLNMDFSGPGEKQKKCAPGYFWCPIDKKCVKDKEEKVEEADVRFEGQRGEGRSLLKALSQWIETAQGDQLKGAYEHILQAYQVAGYPEEAGEKEIGHDFSDDELYDEPLEIKIRDQEKYGYPGDR